MDDGEKARMTVAAFGAAGAAVSLSLQRRDRDGRARIWKGVTSFVAGICSAVLIAPLASPWLDNLLRVETGTTQALFGFLFGVTGYELWKVVYYRASKFLNAFLDKKESDFRETAAGVGDKDKSEGVE